MKFRHKLSNSIIEAFQWFKNGDHPEDKVFPTVGPRGKLWYSEGKVVGFNRPIGTGLEKCQICGFIANHHGWISTKNAYFSYENLKLVHPGDWIAKDDLGYFAIPKKLIEESYDKIT